MKVFAVADYFLDDYDTTGQVINSTTFFSSLELANEFIDQHTNNRYLYERKRLVEWDTESYEKYDNAEFPKVTRTVSCYGDLGTYSHRVPYNKVPLQRTRHDYVEALHKRRQELLDLKRAGRHEEFADLYLATDNIEDKYEVVEVIVRDTLT